MGKFSKQKIADVKNELDIIIPIWYVLLLLLFIYLEFSISRLISFIHLNPPRVRGLVQGVLHDLTNRFTFRQNFGQVFCTENVPQCGGSQEACGMAEMKSWMFFLTNLFPQQLLRFRRLTCSPRCCLLPWLDLIPCSKRQHRRWPWPSLETEPEINLILFMFLHEEKSFFINDLYNMKAGKSSTLKNDSKRLREIRSLISVILQRLDIFTKI